MTEAELQAAVVEACDLYGWLWHHETDSRRTHPGFPDLHMLQRDRLLVVELKAEKGRLTAEQKIWVEAYGRITRVSSGVVRPADLDGLINTLRGQGA